MFPNRAIADKKIYKKLEELNTNDVPLFNLNNCEFHAKCVEVYDGDTITIIIYLFNSFYKFKVRLSYINTPEIRTKNLEEKKAGLEARDHLRELILDKIIKIKCGKFDKYGRLLGEIFLIEQDNSCNGDCNCDISINQKLIDGGYAVPY